MNPKTRTKIVHTLKLAQALGRRLSEQKESIKAAEAKIASDLDSQLSSLVKSAEATGEFGSGEVPLLVEQLKASPANAVEALKLAYDQIATLKEKVQESETTLGAPAAATEPTRKLASYEKGRRSNPGSHELSRSDADAVFESILHG